jgi:hypothetical protein
MVYSFLNTLSNRSSFVVIGILAAIVGFLPINACGNNLGFGVVGMIKEISPDGTLIAQHRFNARIQGCKWIIRTDFSPSSGMSYLEDSFDGDTVYHYIQFAGKVQGITNTSSAVIEINDVPHEKARYATTIWMAFASGCYFEKVKNNHVKQFLYSNDPSLRFTNQQVKVDWESCKVWPSVPVYVDFYDDGFVHSRRNDKPFTIQRLPPYDGGFVSHKYSVMTFTNVENITIPAVFKMETYAPKMHGSDAADLQLVDTEIGSVESITIDQKNDGFAPSIDMATYVEDRRFASFKPPAQQIFYYNTSGRWLPTSSKAVKAVYADYLHLKGTYVEPVSPKAIRTIFVLLVLIPAFFLFGFQFRRWRARHRSK